MLKLHDRLHQSLTSPWKWRHLKSVIVPSVQSPPSMLKLHDFCNRAVQASWPSASRATRTFSPAASPLRTTKVRSPWTNPTSPAMRPRSWAQTTSPKTSSGRSPRSSRVNARPCSVGSCSWACGCSSDWGAGPSAAFEHPAKPSAPIVSSEVSASALREVKVVVLTSMCYFCSTGLESGLPTVVEQPIACAAGVLAPVIGDDDVGVGVCDLARFELRDAIKCDCLDGVLGV